MELTASDGRALVEDVPAADAGAKNATMKSVAVVSFLALMTGCVRPGPQSLSAENTALAEPAPPPQQTRTIDLTEDPADDAQPVVVEQARTPRSSDLAFFRLGAGFGVLGRVDLAQCRVEGLSPGYLHVRVTFHDDGRVVRVASVPVFDGDDVTISRSFFVN
jgi:hypothetical protein